MWRRFFRVFWTFSYCLIACIIIKAFSIYRERERRERKQIYKILRRNVRKIDENAYFRFASKCANVAKKEMHNALVSTPNMHAKYFDFFELFFWVLTMLPSSEKSKNRWKKILQSEEMSQNILYIELNEQSSEFN